MARRLPLTAIIILAIVVVGLLTVHSVRVWRDKVISSNMSLAESAAGRLANDAQIYLRQLPVSLDERNQIVFSASADSLDRHLARLATRTFAMNHGLKGGFWVAQVESFLGYANPWSPPPAPAYGPPPRSHQIILDQVKETIRTDAAIVHLHRFASISVSPAVFPLATRPVYREGRIVAVAWTRIHIERDLPMRKLSRYLYITAIVAISAFLVTLIRSVRQNREVRSLNENLRLIAQDPTHRLSDRTGMFGNIRTAINRMVDALESENRRRHSLEERLHQRDKMAALGKLLAAVSHEVKTPLAILKTRIQIWQRDLKKHCRETGQPSPLSEESIQIALHEIDRLSDLLRKLLFFSRPVRHDLMQPLDADDLIRHTVLFIRPRLVQKRLDLDMALAAPQARILGDPDALHQVFLNILSNSLAMVDEGGLLSIASRVDREAKLLVIELMDNGPGLSPEIREQAFTPFFTTRHGGTGLGLSIAYEIVRNHKGTIEFVEPEGGPGAHCRVTLPLLQAETETP